MFQGTNSPRGARGSKGLRKALETGSSEVGGAQSQDAGRDQAACKEIRVEGAGGRKAEEASAGVQAEGVPW